MPRLFKWRSRDCRCRHDEAANKVDMPFGPEWFSCVGCFNILFSRQAFAIPSPNCSLLLEKEELDIAAGLRIGASVEASASELLDWSLPNDCICGGKVDALGHYCPTSRMENK